MRGPRSLHAVWKRRRGQKHKGTSARQRKRRALAERLEPRLLLNVDVDYEFPKTVAQVLVEGGASPGLFTADPSLPPTDGIYRTAADVHAKFSGPGLQLVLREIQHRPLAEPAPTRTNDGTNETELFQSTLGGTAIFNGQSTPIILNGPVQTIVLGKGPTQTTGSWDTEMLSMDLTGTVSTPLGAFSIQVREDPDRPSPGQTSITDLGGRFQIDSFFDIWTEVSINGSPFVDSTAATHVEVFQSGILTSDPGQSHLISGISVA